MVDQQKASVAKALFVLLIAKDGKGDKVETFLRDGLGAVMEEPDTTTWYAVRFGLEDFAIFDTFRGNEGRIARLAGKVRRALIARAPELLEGIPPASARSRAFGPAGWTAASCNGPAHTRLRNLHRLRAALRTGRDPVRQQTSTRPSSTPLGKLTARGGG